MSEWKKLSILVKKAKGDRTLREYGEDSGVSPSNISKIINRFRH